MITQQELDAAEAAVVEAENDLTQALRHQAAVNSEQSESAVYYARHQAHAARDAERGLRARWEAEESARAARAAAEAEFEPKAEAMAVRLAVARDEAAEAVAVLDRAVVAAMDAVREYSALTQQASGELLAQGLREGEGDGDGGQRDGGVRLRGERWQPADAASMVAAVVSAAVAGSDPRHPLAQQRWRHVGGLAATAGQAALLKAAVR